MCLKACVYRQKKSMLDKLLSLSKEIWYIQLEKHKITHVYDNHHYITIKCPPVQFNEE